MLRPLSSAKAQGGQMAVGFSNVKISGVLVGRREDASPTLSAFTRIRP